MLHHIVLIRWKDGADAGDRQRVADALAALPDRIEAIGSMRVVVDAGLSPTNHHLAVIATFADEAAWRTYQQHPEHVAVVRDLIAPILAERSAIQYTT